MLSSGLQRYPAKVDGKNPELSLIHIYIFAQSPAYMHANTPETLYEKKSVIKMKYFFKILNFVSLQLRSVIIK